MAFRLLQKEINNIVTGNILRLASPLFGGAAPGQKKVDEGCRKGIGLLSVNIIDVSVGGKVEVG